MDFKDAACPGSILVKALQQLKEAVVKFDIEQT
ncbi:hypothetical protein Ga0466249_002525 [Sporomusaceae bacterium BoRhaA]|nr:hypothetical protein [Pelorhabdus rhamnosifermentans]